MKTLVRTISLIAVISLSCVCFSGETEKIKEKEKEKAAKLKEALQGLTRQREELERNQEQLTRQLMELDRQVAETMPAVPMPGSPMTTRTSGIFLAKGRGGQSADISVVITSKDGQPESISQLTEDMGIMARILDKQVLEIPIPKQRTVGFGDMSLYMYTGAVKQNRTRGIYISEYGALFLMDVDFPLKPEPTEEEKEEEKAEAPDIWEQTKGELKGWYQGPGPEPEIKIDKKRIAFDEDKVKELKEKIIKALKYASNIRSLEADEKIIISVKSMIHRGSETSEIKILGRQVGVQTGGGGGYGGSFGGGGYGGAFGTGFGEEKAPKPITGMTIIVEKSDVDAFAEGDVDYDEFLEDVKIVEY